VWLVVYQWGCYSSESFYNWTGIGALAYVTLFQGSTWFTELISKGKYPEYDEYQKRVGKFIPRLRSDIPSDHINENPQPKEAPRPKGK
jgi:steroid 5-alpha reductase family enzyme